MSAVKVAIRTRPSARFAQENILVDPQTSKLSVSMPKGPSAHSSGNAQDSWSWKFDSLLHNASQETVYENQVAPIVKQVLQGYNGTVMCYGQTGAGKTFTMLGSMDSYSNRGITPRAVADIFKFVEDNPQQECKISVSYVEIYQDTLVDLLSTLPAQEKTEDPLQLAEEKGVIYVKGLRQEAVLSEEDALSMLFQGHSNRQTAEHQLNRSSTRGHSVFTIHLRIRSRVDSSGNVTKCKLNLVDLAGSERLKKTATDGVLRAESMCINRSLSYLEQVVVALSSKGRAHTPYRQSKLTHLLKDSLGGNCKTLLIANIYGEVDHLEETISTLQFAARVRLVPNEATPNTEQDPELLLKRYAMEIHDLKRELAMHNSLASRDKRVTYEPYSDAQRIALMEELQAYLDSTDPSVSIELESVRQMRELLAVMKGLYSTQSKDYERVQKSLATGAPFFSSSSGDGGDGVAMHGDDGAPVGEEELVGDEEFGKRGIALGKALDSAKPPGGLVEPPAYQKEIRERAEEEMPATGAPPPPQSNRVMSRSEAYEAYKSEEGASVNSALIASKKAAKDAKAKAKACKKELNRLKNELDEIEIAHAAKKAERESQSKNTDEEGEVIDEEEFNLISRKKAAKKEYKEFKAEADGHMVRAAELEAETEATRESLIKGFDVWYVENFPDAPYDMAPPPASVEKSDAPMAGEVMDDDELFDKMQTEHIMADNPDSLAFFNARKESTRSKRR